MDMKLVRSSYGSTGVYGRFYRVDTGEQISVTLEHSYIAGSVWAAKVATGTYACVRHAPNRLPYETFELQNVPDFQGQPVEGILIHIGNFDKDSEGCILLGTSDAPNMICGSKIDFIAFMALQAGVNSFSLVIE